MNEKKFFFICFIILMLFNYIATLIKKAAAKNMFISRLSNKQH